MAKAGHYSIAYLDDYAGCHASYKEAVRSFNYFSALADKLGLSLATRKSVAPTTKLEWLGYHLDTALMSVTIPDKKLAEVVKECGKWLRKKKAHKKSLQSLAGRLAFISNCILPGRKFMARLLVTIGDMGKKNWMTITNDCVLDIKWFYLYSKSSNGMALYQPTKPLCELECDSSLLGGGGNSSNTCYNACLLGNTLMPIRNDFLNPPPGAKIVVWTDNSASAFALQSGRTKDSVLAACARELWLLAATSSFDIHISHKAGKLIPLADALSRSHQDPTKAALVSAIIKRRNLCVLPPAHNDYEFFNPLL